VTAALEIVQSSPQQLFLSRRFRIMTMKRAKSFGTTQTAVLGLELGLGLRLGLRLWLGLALAR
jgi:hypothetical protein